MDAAGDQDLGLRAAHYLEQLHGLAAELQRGMDFIAGNALADFEESIINQQAIAAHLTRLTEDLALPARSSLIGSRSGDPGRKTQIQAANRHLQVLNTRYSALLKYSSRSAEQMLTLFKGLHRYYPQTSASSHPTWSCEG